MKKHLIWLLTISIAITSFTGCEDKKENMGKDSTVQLDDLGTERAEGIVSTEETMVLEAEGTSEVVTEAETSKMETETETSEAAQEAETSIMGTETETSSNVQTTEESKPVDASSAMEYTVSESNLKDSLYANDINGESVNICTYSIDMVEVDGSGVEALKRSLVAYNSERWDDLENMIEYTQETWDELGLTKEDAEGFFPYSYSAEITVTRQDVNILSFFENRFEYYGGGCNKLLNI